MKTLAIDNGFLLISARDAKRLAGGLLPRPGHEKLVVHEGKHYWLAKTPWLGRQHWSIRLTDWRLVNGMAVLGGTASE